MFSLKLFPLAQHNVILVACLLFILDHCVCTEKSRLTSLSTKSMTNKMVPLMKRSAFPERRLDCDLFCRRTGFAGSVGGCQCGYTLFNVKRSDELSDYTDEPWLNWINFIRSKSILDKYGLTNEANPDNYASLKTTADSRD
ncbi:uncharacterized protein LOC107360284 [Tetranychus urticae]|uniref:uncharacterized protein LOC107360284 n=1 Tax=Tetranychus urticae TaxID=32264 RepID=UPI00077BFC69|nr:uncharacterized protein LOC107360284 [Tetranychus urticae]